MDRRFQRLVEALVDEDYADARKAEGLMRAVDEEMAAERVDIDRYMGVALTPVHDNEPAAVAGGARNLGDRLDDAGDVRHVAYCNDRIGELLSAQRIRIDLPARIAL